MPLQQTFQKFVKSLTWKTPRRRTRAHIIRPSVIEALEERVVLTPTVSLIRDISPWDEDIIMMPTSNHLFYALITDDFIGDEHSPVSDELWITDGTSAGTKKLATVPYFATGSFKSFIEFDGELYFGVTAESGSTEIGLWKSDGTVNGTVQVAQMNGPPIDFAVLNDQLYFKAGDSAHGLELWTSDGTGEGTRMVADIFPGPASAFDRYDGSGIVTFNGKLYFAAESTRQNMELWSSDGTAEGTQLVKNIYTGSYTVPFDNSISSDSNPGSFTVVNDRLVFMASAHDIPNRFYAYTMWVSDGTTEGTVQLKELGGTIAGTTATQMWNPEFLGVYDGLLYFSPETDDLRSSEELWVTDGTLEGTRFVKDMRDGPSLFVELTGSNGLVYFNSGDDVHGEYEPWVTDGTTAGTRLLADLTPGSKDGRPLSSRPSNFASFGDQYTVFRANDGKKGSELWITDGTAAGTVRVTDIYPGKHSSFPYPFAMVGDSLLFFANDPERNGLYKLSPGSQSPGPVIDPQSFTVAENLAADSVVGTVVATPGPKQKLTFSIVAGNTNGTFDIDAATGRITIANPAGLDFESVAQFQLTVRVAPTKNASLSASAVVTINVTDVSESISLNVATSPLSVVSKSSPTVIDPQATLTINGLPPATWGGAILVVKITQNRQAKDQLSLQSDTNSPDGIRLKGKSLLRGTVPIATVSGGKGKQGTLRITFLAAATTDDVQTVLRQLTFATKGSAGQRPVALQLVGVGGSNSAAVVRPIQVS